MRESVYVDPVGDGRYQSKLRYRDDLEAWQLIDYVGGESIGDVILTRPALIHFFGEDAVKRLEANDSGC